MGEREEAQDATPLPVSVTENRPEHSSHEKGEVDFSSNPSPQPFIVQDDGTPPEDRSDADSGPETLLGDETYPEGGLQAWLVVLGAWCALLAALGLMNSIGTFQTYVATNQLSAYEEGTVGWIFSLYSALAFFCGIYIGPLFDRFGPKWLIFPGSVCVVAAVMIMSACTEYWHFLLTFGFLSGVGTSLLFTPSITAVGHFFRDRRGLASGIASTGGGVGGIIFPLMLTSLFERVGWAWAVRILGFLCMFLLIFANLLIRKRLPAAKNASPHPDFRIFRDRAFALLTFGVFLLEFGLFIPLAYISSYALSRGFDATFAFQIVPILNAGSVFGRVFPGWLADKIGPYNSNLMSLCITIFGCYVVWLPFGGTTPGLVIFAVLFGFATGNNISITPVCISRLCHTQHYGRYYATCYTIVSIACLIGIPVGGSIVQATDGDYWGLIVFVGLTQALAFGFIYAAKAVKVGWKPWTKF
ncbi:hypothetical protein DL766_008177 [Monosporascus sp. MC13-8B]|uniref:Major facilitator superfamily (MFS) profile domain-containing protein n=1 Tax=Monosporascus cannonballus TaxID=155416 RepID=A0ABY0GR66_9PEZI|nr:hypothetical protein DL762_010235 [Monosporascus cannonballus]RYO82863.1 hypothetical protein DL763_008095 [Monosporascus cannonballus]RYP20544.1 hypothetical protein DL766_008177 [Monosporascus sp. MC13-8B]